ncbi:MBL fold metallo-hydrolase [Treponema parvum]|uniref:MBL fold metallo-hydrolase n=1 Tax=Treponema parvum TaxID=138851 RepID=UPI001AEBACD7|nr:ribonuclease Z [Treponema parvum]QTQ16029.1 ribonuclease Z [Treponema parvum]
MKLIFLGKQGCLQSASSGNTSLLVDSGKAFVLIDTSGSPAQLIRQAGYDPMDLDAVILTHAHIDHLYALPSLIHNLWILKRSKPLHIVGSAATLECAKALCGVFSLFQKENMIPVRWTVYGGKPVELAETLRVELFDVDHSIQTCGVLLTDGSVRFAYSADTRMLKEIPIQMHNADLLVHEAGGTASDEAALEKAGHSSARQAAATAAKAQAKRLILCHLPLAETVQNDMAAEATSVFPNTSIPELFTPYEI